MSRRALVDASTRGVAGRGRTSAAHIAGAIVVALFALSACRPLYIPLVPTAPEAPTALKLSESSHLGVVDRRLRLELSIAATDAARLGGTWLNVQWFGPSGRQAASESQWLEYQSAVSPAAVVFQLPSDVVVVVGEWRAVVSVDGLLLRQFRVDVLADPEE